jgi:hypothetical protein
VGRPRKASDIRQLALDMARDNPGWGYTKIRDALRGRKIEIGRTTVASILAEAGVEPTPERNRKRTWARFLKSHWATLYACDFFGRGLGQHGYDCFVAQPPRRVRAYPGQSVRTDLGRRHTQTTSDRFERIAVRNLDLAALDARDRFRAQWGEVAP